MPFEDSKILKINQNQKSDKASFITYVDLEFLIEKIYGCKNNPENSSTTKVSEHISSGFSMSTISSFKVVVFVKKNLKINMTKIKNIVKLWIIIIIQVNIEVLHIAYVI